MSRAAVINYNLSAHLHENTCLDLFICIENSINTYILDARRADGTHYQVFSILSDLVYLYDFKRCCWLSECTISASLLTVGRRPPNVPSHA